jgi:hypothetical protein
MNIGGYEMYPKRIKAILILGLLVGSLIVINTNVLACYSISVELTDGDNQKYANKGEYALYEITISLSPGCKSTYWLSYNIEGVLPGWDAVILNQSGGVIDLTPTEYVYSGTVDVIITVKHTAPSDPGTSESNGITVIIYATDYYNQDDTILQDITTVTSDEDLAPNPVVLSQSGATTAQINLTWTESDLNPLQFDRYELHRSDVPGFTPVSGTLLESFINILQTDFEVLGLSPGTTYYFCVRVWDKNAHVAQGPLFADSNVLEASTFGINYPPGAVILNDPFDVTNREATLTWTQNFDDDFAHYEIHASLDPGFIPGPETRFTDPITNQTILEYVVTGLDENEVIYFKIRVVDAGNMYNDSNEVSCTTLDYVPPASVLDEPFNTTGYDTNLTWSQNCDTDFDRYEIHKSLEPGFTIDSSTWYINTYMTTDNSTSVKGLEELTTYYFKIRVYDKTGNFADSNEVFTTTLDKTPPQITKTVPFHDSIDVEPSVDLVITFSEKIDSTTLLYACFPDPGGWTVSWDAQGTNATFTHSNDFDDDAIITFEITQARDMGGNDLDEITKPVQNPFSFTTKDITPPEISGTTPSDDAVDILCNCDISITFSEDMDHSSVEGAITAQFTFDTSWNGNTITITPDDDLDFSTEYVIQVKTTAKDSSGNNLQSKYTFSFTTEEEDVNHAPEIVVSSEFDDEADETYTIEWTASDIDGDPLTISIYYDSDEDDSKGLKLIKAGYSNKGSYEWDTSDVPEGEYYVYIKANDGENEAGAYIGKLSIAHAEEPDDGGQGGVDPEGSDDADYFPLILLIIIIAAILVAVLVGVKVLGSKKPQGMGQTITCPNCQMQFTADTTVSPYVTCPNCGTSGMMR